MREQPNLASAALDLVGIDVGTVRQWCQCAAKLDDIAIAVVPLIEQRKILNDLVNRSHDASYIGPARGNGQKR